MCLVPKNLAVELDLEIRDFKKNADAVDFSKIEEDLSVYAYFFIIRKTHEEDYAWEFVKTVKCRFRGIVDMYCPEKGCFLPYFAGVLFSSYRLYMKNIRLAERNQRIADSFIVRDNTIEMLDDENKMLMLSEHEESYSDGRSVAKISMCGHERTSMLALLLYVSPGLDDKTIHNVAFACGFDYDKLMRMICESVDSADDRMDEMNNQRELRNFYYTRKRNLLNKENITPLNEQETRVLGSCERRRESHVKRLNSLNRISQKKVAEILGVDYKNVRRMIYNAKRLLERLLDESGKLL